MAITDIPNITQKNAYGNYFTIDYRRLQEYVAHTPLALDEARELADILINGVVDLIDRNNEHCEEFAAEIEENEESWDSGYKEGLERGVITFNGQVEG